MKKHAHSLILALCLFLTACTGDTAPGEANASTSTMFSVDFAQTPEDMFTDRDRNTDYSSGTLIQLNGDSVSCSDSSVTISGGYTTVVGPTTGDTATLDFDTTGIITGGTFIGTGASNMAITFSDSENQGVIAVSVGNQAAGTLITLTDKSGNVVISYTPELAFGVVILSSPDIVKGQTYTITVGSASGSFAAS